MPVFRYMQLDLVVTSRLRGSARGNRRVFLDGSQLPRTHPRTRKTFSIITSLKKKGPGPNFRYMKQLTGAGVVNQVWSGVRWRRAGGEVGRKKLGSMGCMGNEHAVGKKVVARGGKRKAGATVTVLWVLKCAWKRVVWLLVQQAVSDVLQLGADWADTSHMGW